MTVHLKVWLFFWIGHQLGRDPNVVALKTTMSNNLKIATAYTKTLGDEETQPCSLHTTYYFCKEDTHK